MLSLQEISDHIEIRQVLATYSRGVDRWDRALLRSVYHEDATDNHSVFNGSGWDFADWVVGVYEESRGPAQHHLTNIYIELHGDFANVETYYIAYQSIPDKDNVETALFSTGGRYLDRFERRDGVWKIAKREVTVEWSRSNIPGEIWEGAALFPAIGPRGKDPMYKLFDAA